MQTQTNTLATPATPTPDEVTAYWAGFHQAAEEEEAKLKLAKQQERMLSCGLWLGKGVNPLTGNFQSFIVKCGCFQDDLCPICMSDRINEVKERLWRAINDNKVTISVTHDRSTVTQGLSKDKYLALPIKTEMTKTFNENFAVFVVDGNGIQVTKEWIARLSREHLVELCNTPAGKRMSGTLGKLPEKKKAKLGPGQVKVSYSSIIYHPDNSDDLNKEAEKAAMTATSELDPKDKDSLQQALSVRMMALKKCVIELGGQFTNGFIRFNTVSLDRVRWR